MLLVSAINWRSILMRQWCPWDAFCSVFYDIWFVCHAMSCAVFPQQSSARLWWVRLLQVQLAVRKQSQQSRITFQGECAQHCKIWAEVPSSVSRALAKSPGFSSGTTQLLFAHHLDPNIFSSVLSCLLVWFHDRLKTSLSREGNISVYLVKYSLFQFQAQNNFSLEPPLTCSERAGSSVTYHQSFTYSILVS